MVTAAQKPQLGFFSVLAAEDRSAEIPEPADVYGWLCGSWDHREFVSLAR